MCGMTPIKVLVIEPDGEARIESVIPDLDNLKRLIGGGWLEAVAGDLGAWVAYGDEEGALKGLAPNIIAAGICRIFRPDRPVLPVGTVIFLGSVHVGGETGYVEADVPQAFIDLVLPVESG